MCELLERLNYWSRYGSNSCNGTNSLFVILLLTTTYYLMPVITDVNLMGTGC